jgi:predicted metal-binding membrane protein
MSTPLEAAFDRDRLIVGAALAVVTLLAWAYLFWLAAAMAGAGAMPDMPDMNMAAAVSPRLGPWTAAEFALAFVMWAVMMVGMMTPSAAPMILLYAGVARRAGARARPLAATGWFAGGYLLSWILFSLAATAAQAGLERAVGLTPMMTVASGRIGAGVLMAAGLYQWTPIKDSCLAGCRTPLAFIQQRGGFQAGAARSLRLGLDHGLYCIGCCWALMALLFVGGVMNLAWIAAIALVVLAEKVGPRGRLIARLAGVGLVASGVWLLVRLR